MPDTPMDAEFLRLVADIEDVAVGRQHIGSNVGAYEAKAAETALWRWHREQVEKAREEGFKDGTDEERGY